jgi:hypothetical protein
MNAIGNVEGYEILPAWVRKWGCWFYKKHAQKLDSRDDYWQTVSLVWLNCKDKLNPNMKPEHYFIRAMVREFITCGKKRYRATVLLKAFSELHEETIEEPCIDDMLGMIKTSEKRPALPESLRELDYGIFDRVEGEVDHLLKESDNV